jgi:acetaldehyde dehydrogenase (acetylating)
LKLTWSKDMKLKNAVASAKLAGSNVKASAAKFGGRVFVAVAGVATVMPSFAADGDIDTTAALAAIAAGLAAGLLVSASMTGAKISVRASKLPRAGA